MDREKEITSKTLPLSAEEIRISELKSKIIKAVFHQNNQDHMLNDSMLNVCDLTVIRNVDHEHEACGKCGQCYYCTVPHDCCCGKCGTTCSHEHEAMDKMCFMMQELNHADVQSPVAFISDVNHPRGITVPVKFKNMQLIVSNSSKGEYIIFDEKGDK